MNQTMPLYTFQTPYRWMAGESLEVYPDRLRYHQYSGLFERSYEDIRIESIEQIRLAEGFGRFYGVGDLQIRTQGILPIFIRIQKLKYATVARDFIMSLQYGQHYDLDAAIRHARTARHQALSMAAVATCVLILMAGWTTVKVVTNMNTLSRPAIAAMPATPPIVTKRPSPEPVTEVPVAGSYTPTLIDTPTPLSMPHSTKDSWHCDQRFAGSQWQYFVEQQVERSWGLSLQQFGALVQTYNPQMFTARADGKEPGVFYADETYCLPVFIPIK